MSVQAQDAPADRRPAKLLVWVISAETGVPLEGSRVAMTLRRDNGVITDSVGRAFLRGLEPRLDMLTVRRVGYVARSFALELQPQDSLELTVVLNLAAVVLDTVVTTGVGASTVLAPGFNGRKKQGNGHFLDRAEINRRSIPTLPELLRTVPGLRLESAPQGGRWLRSARAGLTHDCPMMLYVDGVEVASETTTISMIRGRRVVQRGTSIFDSIPPEMIEALEVYTTSNVPAQFNRGDSGCGVVVMWMRPHR